jgi:hypothetical protein
MAEPMAWFEMPARLATGELVNTEYRQYCPRTTESQTVNRPIQSNITCIQLASRRRQRLQRDAITVIGTKHIIRNTTSAKVAIRTHHDRVRAAIPIHFLQA